MLEEALFALSSEKHISRFAHVDDNCHPFSGELQVLQYSSNDASLSLASALSSLCC
jgi:hypothetical protein